MPLPNWQAKHSATNRSITSFCKSEASVSYCYI